MIRFCLFMRWWARKEANMWERLNLEGWARSAAVNWAERAIRWEQKRHP